MDDNDALKVTFFFLTSFLVCHASFSLLDLAWTISKNQDRQGCPLVFVGHGYGGLVLKQALVELHHESNKYKVLRSNPCGIVFYAETNTKFINKGWPWRLFSLMFKIVKDDLSELSKCFEAALDLKKVNVCVVNKNKSNLQVCIFYPYSN
jgi:hypothetical protein